MEPLLQPQDTEPGTMGQGYDRSNLLAVPEGITLQISCTPEDGDDTESTEEGWSANCNEAIVKT